MNRSPSKRKIEDIAIPTQTFPDCRFFYVTSACHSSGSPIRRLEISASLHHTREDRVGEDEEVRCRRGAGVSEIPRWQNDEMASPEADAATVTSLLMLVRMLALTASHADATVAYTSPRGNSKGGRGRN